MWKQKITIVSLVLVPMIGLSPLALAEEEGTDQSKWYVGAGLGISRLEPESNGSRYTVDKKESAGYRLTLGYDLYEKISVEGYYSDLGEAEMSPDGEVSYKDMGASGLYYFYQQHDRRHKGWEAFIKAGVGWMKNDTDLDYERQHNTHVMFGAGGGYTFDNDLSVRLDMDLYDEDSQFLILSLTKRFGQKKRAKPVAEKTSSVVVQPVTSMVAQPVVREVEPPADRDADGVIDAEDMCPETAQGKLVDAVGCTIIYDKDGDGVVDDQDKCPDTPQGAQVNSVGCLSTIVLEGVNFENDKSVLTEQAKRILDNVAVLLKSREDILKIEVFGHTDDRGRALYNQQLSEARAIRVRDYLSTSGISGYLMRPVGMGESEPIASNVTAKGRQMNRRVELRLFYK
jgi:OOP family OmpA-OmpF porin